MRGLLSAWWSRLTTPRVDRLNTLDLVGDLDDVELLMEIEAHFQVQFSSDEAEALRTIGQACDLSCAKIGARLTRDDVWGDLCRICRAYTRSEHPFDAETTFMARAAQPRTPGA